LYRVLIALQLSHEPMAMRVVGRVDLELARYETTKETSEAPVSHVLV
jgi:hypothetical protein